MLFVIHQTQPLHPITFSYHQFYDPILALESRKTRLVLLSPKLVMISRSWQQNSRLFSSVLSLVGRSTMLTLFVNCYKRFCFASWSTEYQSIKALCAFFQIKFNTSMRRSSIFLSCPDQFFSPVVGCSYPDWVHGFGTCSSSRGFYKFLSR